MSLSVFTPVPVESFVITPKISNQSEEELNEKLCYSHFVSYQWNDEITIFVMLKYKKWQLSQRKYMTLNEFLKECSECLINNFHFKKSPTQIRDKINNTKSSYANILKKSTSQLSKEKNLPLTKKLFDFMNIYFNGKYIISIDILEEQISLLMRKFISHINTSCQLKSAILKMKNLSLKE
ncbi:hypothetical protein EDI_281580 [Entamoeba dispar SAW760]|uniref:Uncharacterized protein n=1 Tax=Entamoeba dispar (strain ATCC PRA-260 / SAW760) TaxID=370354 RepID=B0EP52_ENTDS|nr:uncharacterized protein EDI_281580 [Entamoeba dispar SAW760]EDR23682.1 hypothetical protein EDI_281580 [Entamoeba dispar SAW760]|eukprot:EDR23682.1 hypothetical protein EDI_281580 [Entamoeba dispar SAW760]